LRKGLRIELRYHLLLFFAFELLLLLVFIKFGLQALLLILGFSVLLFIVLRRLENLLLLLCLLMIIFPAAGQKTPINLPGVNAFLIYSFVSIAFIASILRGFLRETREVREYDIDPFFLFFSWTVLLALVFGFLKGNTLTSIIREFSFLFGYSTYWIVTRAIRRERFIKPFVYLLIFGGTLIGIMFTFYFFFFRGIRVSSRQGNIALLSFLFSLNAFFYLRMKLWDIIFFTIGAIASFTALIFSLQRALWVAIPPSIFLFLSLAYLKGRLSLGKLLFFFGTVTISVFSFLKFLEITGISWYSKVAFQRALTLTRAAAQVSYRDRIRQIKRVIREVSSSPVFGKGIGSHKKEIEFIDNSPMTMYLKGGLLGVLGLLTFYFAIFLLPLRRLREEEDEWKSFYLASFVTCIFAFLIVGMTTSLLVMYHYTFLIGVMAGLAAKGKTVIKWAST